MAYIQWELFWRILTENPNCCDEVEGSVNGEYTIFGYLPEVYWRGDSDSNVQNEFPFWVGYCDEPEGACFRTAEEFVSTPLYGGKSVKEVWQQFGIEGWLCGDCKDWLEHSGIPGIQYDAGRDLYHLSESTEENRDVPPLPLDIPPHIGHNKQVKHFSTLM